MKEGWKVMRFEDCLVPVIYPRKIQRKEFLEYGPFPIVSQEAASVNGYWDNPNDVFKVNSPVVLFGDHTRTLKYVDFDFVLGADGVKILKPNPVITARFLYHQLCAVSLPSFGYARHYRALKELELTVPPLSEQHRIVEILDKAFADIAKAKANAERNLQNARELFESHLQSVFTQRGPGWVDRRLGDVLRTGAGGTPLRSKKEYYEGGTIPWLMSGEVSQGEVTVATKFITAKGLENSSARMFPPDTVLVAMYGATAGQVGILRFEAATNQAVCGILPNDNFVPEFLFYFLLARKDELVAQATGNAQPNISQVKIKNTEVPVIPLTEQREIVDKLNGLSEENRRLARIYERKLDELEALKKSILHKAFSGEL